MGSPWDVWLSLVIWVWMEGSLVGEAEKVIEFYKMCRKGVERRREGSLGWSRSDRPSPTRLQQLICWDGGISCSLHFFCFICRHHSGFCSAQV